MTWMGFSMGGKYKYKTIRSEVFMIMSKKTNGDSLKWPVGKIKSANFVSVK